ERELSPQALQRALALRAFAADDFAGARKLWSSQTQPPRGPVELEMCAELFAQVGDEANAMPCIDRLRAFEPAEADVCLAPLRVPRGRRDEARVALTAALERYRNDPWPMPDVMERGLVMAKSVVSGNPAAARELFAALREPFAVLLSEGKRRAARLDV